MITITKQKEKKKLRVDLIFKKPLEVVFFIFRLPEMN